MKIRLTQTGVRFRLTQSEVRTLGEHGSIQESVAFIPKNLRIELRTTGVDAPAASFDGTVLSAELPRNQVRTWAASDEVGLEGESNGVRILIEKDFKCLHPSDPADNQDTFPNPAL